MSGGRSLTEIWRSAVGGGGRLPPETELADLLGMGRNSVREVLIRLEADGYVSRRHGAGTFANPAAMDAQIRVDRTQEYADLLRALGCEPRIELLEAGWVQATPETLERLRAEPGTLVFRTCKRWLADGAPVMYAEDLVPARRRVAVDATRSVLEIASTVNGHTTEWVSSLVEARLAGEYAAALGVTRAQPLLHFEQVGVSRDGQRCWLAKEYHNGNAGPRPLRYGLVRTVMTSDDDHVIGVEPASPPVSSAAPGAGSAAAGPGDEPHGPAAT